MRGKRTPGKSSDTLQSAKVRFVKFTPEEMAYEAPADVSDPKRYPALAKGRSEWHEFLSFKRGYIKLAPDLRKAFPTEEAVNEALRVVANAAKALKRKKIA